MKTVFDDMKQTYGDVKTGYRKGQEMSDRFNENLKNRRKASEDLKRYIASDIEGYKKNIINASLSATGLFFIRHWIISLLILALMIGLLQNHDTSGAIIILIFILACIFIYKFISLKTKINSVENNLRKDPNYYEEYEIDE